MKQLFGQAAQKIYKINFPLASIFELRFTIEARLKINSLIRLLLLFSQPNECNERFSNQNAFLLIKCTTH